MTLRSGTTTLITSALLFSGCTSDSSSSNSVQVPLTQAASGGDYRLRTTATISNEEFDDGQRAQIHVQAMPSTSNPPNNRTPLLNGVIEMRDGAPSISCAMPRTYVWSDFAAWNDLDLTCVSEVDLSNAQSVIIS